MNFICKEELLNAIQNKYGDLDDECGCNVYVNGEYEWLSIKDIVNLINECTTHED